MLAFGMTQAFFTVPFRTQPWLSLLCLPTTMLGAAALMHRILGEPVAPLAGPPAPLLLEQKKWLHRLPKAMLFMTVMFGGLGWLMLHFEPPQPLLIALPPVTLLALLFSDLACIYCGIYASINFPLVNARASKHVALFAFLCLFVPANIISSLWQPLEIRMIGETPTAALIALFNIAGHTVYFALAVWVLLAQALGTMLNLPATAALARAARAMWRNSPAFILHILVLAGAATATISALKHMPGAAPLPELIHLLAESTAESQSNIWLVLACALLALCIFMPTLLIPPWLMVRDIFREAAAPADETENKTDVPANAIPAAVLMQPV
ncbi:MAG: hypothetical protein IJR28_00050, partial [Ottowia sp.]|nr:hypothetical protein [Ottowia sp.]